MRQIIRILTVVAAVAACDNTTPAGGRGPFEPLPDYPAANTLGGLPPRLATPAQLRAQAAARARVEAQARAVAEAQARADAQALAQAQGQPVQLETAALPQSTPPTTPQVGAPRSALGTPANPDEALAQDVTAVLSTTGQGTPGAAGVPLPDASDIGIDPNDESINLALSSQEVQERQRAAAQRRREAAQQQLVIVEPEPVPQQNVNANVVAFARATTHPVGTRTYNRPAFRSRSQAAATCRRFDTVDEAQRQFLANGGPTTDRYNLDPDGDGFACAFDPERYRQLKF